MRISGYRPSNPWIERELDVRWRRWLTVCLAGAAAVVIVLAGIVGPRQTTLRLRYDIARLNQEVDALEHEQRRLQLDRERLTSPELLTREAASLDLAPVPRDRVYYLGAGGELVAAVPPADEEQVR